jgi:predicted transcriptional regulator
VNIEDASLTHRILSCLIGSQGKSIGQIANTCGTSTSRINHLLLLLEKAGLISISVQQKVTLSDHLAEIAYAHADALDANAARPIPLTSSWNRLIRATSNYRQAVKAAMSENSEAHQEVFQLVFGGRA